MNDLAVLMCGMLCWYGKIYNWHMHSRTHRRARALAPAHTFAKMNKCSRPIIKLTRIVLCVICGYCWLALAEFYVFLFACSHTAYVWPNMSAKNAFIKNRHTNTQPHTRAHTSENRSEYSCCINCNSHACPNDGGEKASRAVGSPLHNERQWF